MHLPIVLAVILVCLTVTCNGQFKILGLLDTKSEISNGKVENIRSLDEVPDQYSDETDVVKSSEFRASDSNADNGNGNVNFIKPYEAVTNEWKKDFVETTSESVKNDSTNGLLGDETDSENVSSAAVPSSQPSIRDSTSEEIFESNTASTSSTTTTRGKGYRKSFLPNIRKFSYIEARSFHHPDTPNNATPQWNNNKFVKVLKQRNKYKSKCRCERISNCPKIQISIQRCEPDHFMCCF